ncbi:GTP-binding protein [Peribacillus sp. V2I11]|uniref:CobW family GTP-binding protein n=1 Tax=Peribacillus sp. V2I11 TaxID=3042277 RepID=UPI0027886386|nr:GTP-binding protein [Peribacillus sp. V2I11]MDQ0879212.1 G3E family GTPase [Peribacillus sp. V2I11]
MKKIPVYIISGFLGSGKTTLLTHILEYYKTKNMKPAIVLNELGKVNVEAHLFGNEHVFELLNGCICCTIQDDLRTTLTTLLDSHVKNPIDVLFIEGTGVANPLEIVEVIASPPLVHSFEIQTIISVVDASCYLEDQSIFTFKSVRDLLKNQITGATLVLLNKVDLVNEKQLQKVQMKLTKFIDPNTQVMETSYGSVDVEKLLQKRSNAIIYPHHHSACSHIHHEHTHHHVHHNGIKTLTIQNVPSISRRQLKKWLRSLPEGIVRGKGYVSLSEGQGIYPFQYSSNQVYISNLPREQTAEPCIVLIGRDVDITHIQNFYTSQFLLK